ncbi:MAG TPA: DUF4252 domain-containing protein, partial [Acidobacteriaceae bacterium]|nr:DUF4252 domain-containing protein [Acidobacteriaceae bacterium]
MKTIRSSVWTAMAAAACVVVAPHPGKAQMAAQPSSPMVLVAAVAGEAQVKDDLFAGTEKFAQGASEVNDVNLDKNMLGMVSKGKGSGLAGKMDYVVVHSYTYDKPGMYRMEDVDVFRKKLTDGTWSCFVHTRDRSGSTDVCKKSDDNATELVVITAEPKELTFVHMRGNMSLGDLMKMHGSFGDAP